MASVKDLVVEAEPTGTDLGRGTFVFSDAYSVFDWGQMPDEIPGKGASLCSMGAHTFETLEAEGVPTHYRGVGAADDPIELAEHFEPPRRMAIELTQVPDLPFGSASYDYDAFHDAAGENYLVPLEIVYRNQVPVGSSLRRRSDPADHDLDFAVWPDHSVELIAPIIEFSTKFESADRYLDREEAARIAGAAPVEELEALAKSVNEVVSRLADQADMTHLDGKIECLYHRGSIKVADVAGTLDENRFAAEGRQLSKEVIRQYYARTDSDWVAAVSEAKKAAAAENDPAWKDRVNVDPDSLPGEVIDTVSDMYGGVANAYVGRPLFRAPPVHAVAASIGDLTAA